MRKIDITPIVAPKSDTKPPKQPALSQSEEKWLAEWELQHQIWSEYYHCCGGY